MAHVQEVERTVGDHQRTAVSAPRVAFGEVVVDVQGEGRADPDFRAFLDGVITDVWNSSVMPGRWG